MLTFKMLPHEQGIKRYPGASYYSFALACPDMLTFRDSTTVNVIHLLKPSDVHFIYFINLRFLGKTFYKSR